MTSSNFQGHSQAEIKSATLISLSTEQMVDIKRGITKLEMYCSVFDPTMAMVVRIMDSSSTLYQLPMVGEELVEIEIASSGREPITRVMAVTKVEDLAFDSNGTCTGMTLHLMSFDQLPAVGTTVYKGAKCQISELVSALIKDYLKPEQSTKLNVEETEGIETLIIPGWNVWESIEFLRSRAVSTKYHSPFLFFEGLEGYHFISVEGLVEQRLKKTVETYTSEPFNVENSLSANKSTISERQRRNVDNLRIVSKANPISTVMNGGHSTTVRTFNMLQKEVVEATNDYTEMGSLMKRPLEGSFYPNHTAKLKNLVGKDSSRAVTFVVDDSNVSSSITNYGRRNIISHNFGEVQIEFSTFGNTELDVGDIIKLEMPRTVDMQEEDLQLTGHYMITSFCHHYKDGHMLTAVEAYRVGFGSRVF